MMYIITYTCITYTADMNPCSSDLCFHGTCTNLVYDYTCTCENGYDGKDCDNGRVTCS